MMTQNGVLSGPAGTTCSVDHRDERCDGWVDVADDEVTALARRVDALDSRALIEEVLEQTPDTTVYAALFETLRRRAPDAEAAQTILDAYEAGRVDSWLAAEVLGWSRHPAGFETLCAMLSSGERGADTAGAALAQLGGDEAARALLGYLAPNHSVSTRCAAAHGLAHLGTTRALDAIADACVAGRVPMPRAVDCLSPRIALARVESLLAFEHERARVLGAEIVAQWVRHPDDSFVLGDVERARLAPRLDAVLASAQGFFRRSTRRVLEELLREHAGRGAR